MESRGARSEAIAIVGIACQFPGARDPAELHDLAVAGRRMFRPVSRQPEPGRAEPSPALPGAALLPQAALAPAALAPAALPQAALLNDWAMFAADDHEPIRKLTAETAALALADAGITGASPARSGPPRTGMIIASSVPGVAEATRQVLGIATAADIPANGGFPADGGFPANRGFPANGGFPAAAYRSSLDAIAAGCEALSRGELDVVIAGGSELGLDADWLARQAAAGLLGTDSMLVYDARPAGLLPGDGCGVVVLVRAADAHAAGRPVYAEIAGWTTAARTSTGGGLDPAGSEELSRALRQAYDRAGVGPSDVAMVEGQGAGTTEAEATELAMLTRLRHGGTEVAALGAVSACIGHARAAAGVASLIKTVTAMVAGTIPPGTGCPHPHPLIESGAARLRMPSAPEAWPDGTRLAAVSSLGPAGINGSDVAHLVLRREPDRGAAHGRRRRPAEHSRPPSAAGRHTGPMTVPDSGPLLAAPSSPGRHTAPIPRRPPDDVATKPVRIADRGGRPTVFALCGAEPAAVAATLDVIGGSAAELADTDMRDLGRQLAAAAQQAARRGAPLRVAVTAGSPAELSVQVRRAAQLLRAAPATAGGGAATATTATTGTTTGSWPTVTTAPGIAIGAGARGRIVLAFSGLVSTPAEHSALLAASLDGLRVLDRLGVRARAAVGYSSGEIAALVWAGCLPATEAARLAAYRGHVLRGCGARPTAMARVTADLELTQRLCMAHGLQLAACETPTSHLVAGQGGGIRNLARRAAESGVAVDVLAVATAVHSPALAACTAPLRGVLAGIAIGPPRRQLISTITGKPLTATDDLTGLLAGQLSRPVLFAQAMALAGADADLVVVAGPDGDPASPHAAALPGQRSLSALAAAAAGIPAIQASRAATRPDRAATGTTGTTGTTGPAGPADPHTVATLFAAGAISELLPFLGQETVKPAEPEALGRVSGLARAAAPSLPVGPQRHVRRAVLVQSHAEHLMQLDMVTVETETGAGHVQPPYPRGALADLLDRGVPVVVEVGAPGGERLRVVLAQVFLVPDLEAGVVHQRDQVAGAFQLAVREDIPVDEALRAVRAHGVVRTGDAVVEQPRPRLELAVEEREVSRQVPHADVLGEPDRTHRVEAGLGNVAVVEVADLGELAQSVALDGGLPPGGLLGGQRDADRLDAVLARGVPDHAAPAAADVQQPHSGPQPELARDQVELIDLRLLQGGIGLRVARAGVRHRRAEHPPVEGVGHVVVVRDRLRVATLAVPPADHPAPVLEDLLGRRRDAVHEQLGAAQRLEQLQLLDDAHVQPLRPRHPGESLVHIAVHVEVAGHVSPGQAQRARRLRQVGDRYRRAHGEFHRRVRRTRVRAVVGREFHRCVRTDNLLEDLRQRHALLPFPFCS